MSTQRGKTRSRCKSIRTIDLVEGVFTVLVKKL